MATVSTSTTIPRMTPAVEPISRAQVELVAQARLRRRKLDRAMKVAGFGGWVSAILAALSAPFVFMSWESGAVAVGLGLVAYHEFKGRRLLQALDVRGPSLLGYNQVAFAGMIVVYSVWQIIKVQSGHSGYEEAITAEPMLADMLGPMEQLIQTAMVGVYVAMIVATLLFQGGTAWYYFSRLAHLREYRQGTPEWVHALV